MTGGAFRRSRFVEKNILCVEQAYLLVTGFTTNVAMHALQREAGEFVVIEKRGLPLGAVVTVDAGRNPGLGELLSVWILVALLTLLWCRLEVHMEKPGLEIRGLVAVDAGGSFVCTEQGKVRLRMIKAG